MGHDERQTDYEIAQEERVSRSIALKESTRSFPLGHFMVEDLPILLRVAF